MAKTKAASNNAVEPDCIVARDELIKQYIEKHGGRYSHLKAAADIHSASDALVVDQALFEDSAASQREEMKKLSDQYFKFRIEFFRFSRRLDRTFRDLFHRPQTHSDLAEEDIERKFPEDRKTRALIKAFHLVIRSNQLLHIFRKRFIQFVGGSAIAVVAGAWLHFGYAACGNLAGLITTSSAVVMLLAWIFWLVAAIAIITAVWSITQLILVWRLTNTTDHFKEANQTSCANLRASMTGFNATVSLRFTNLLNVIKSSEDNSELVKKHDWPAVARDLFKIAMWEGKRIESMEQFWQFQFERLRLLELVTDRVGNLTSRILAGVMIVVFAAALPFCLPAAPLWQHLIHYTLILGIVTTGIWRIGTISRSGGLSFGMQDIIDQGFEDEWQTFGALGYYDKIAQEFENGMGAKRLEKIKERML